MRPVTSQDPRIILASGSPRRLELVQRIGLEPVVVVSDVPEVKKPDETPLEYTRRLALLKASKVAERVVDREDLPDWILAADTIVVRDGEVLEKPADPDDAFRMLRELSEQWHTVITSFCWVGRGGADGPVRASVTRAVEARVHFRELSDEMIRRYVATGEPMDKAGAYGIQDIGSTIVREIEGSYFCVVGLPVCEVVEELERLGGLTKYPFLTPPAS